MNAARILLLSLLPACIVVPASRADDFPEKFIQEQLDQAARPIDADLRILRPGEIRSIEYVGRPIFVYRRTEADRAYLAKAKGAEVADPSGANRKASLQAAYGSSASLVWARLLLADQPTLEKRRTRSYREDYLVVAGWSPHSGCALRFEEPSRRARENVVFTDSCLSAAFDPAGRVLKGALGGIAAGQQAAFNLYIPPHYFKSSNKLAIGLRPKRKLPHLGFSYRSLYRERDPTHNLVIAARYNDTRMVESTLAGGADVNAFQAADGSPIDAAIIGSSIETVKLLLERGARPTSRSRRAAEFVGRAEVIDLLEKNAR